MSRPRHSEADFSALSRDWLEASDPLERKRRGQYLTPRGLRERLLDHVDLRPGMRVLDPGVGTGEFLASVLERAVASGIADVEVSGWDTDPSALATARELVATAGPDASSDGRLVERLEERSAMDPWTGEKFDLVIGNPPYFQFRASAAQRKRFAPVISGRPNIFALFFQAGMEVLADGGQLAFVVPPSLNNGAYFEGLREYLTAEAAIEHLEVMDGSDLFEGANTAVQLIVLRKGGGNGRVEPGAGKFTFTRADEEAGFRRVIFTSNSKELAAQFEGRRTLWELGYQAATGRIVWNQNRDLLRTAAGNGTVPLVWARNVTKDGVQFDGNPEKPEHIVSADPSVGPAVLVNRVVGAVGRGEMRAAAIPKGEPFLAENHVNVLTPRPGFEPERSRADLAGSPGHFPPVEEVAALINGKGVGDRVRLLTGNAQISAKELTHLLPL